MTFSCIKIRLLSYVAKPDRKAHPIIWFPEQLTVLFQVRSPPLSLVFARCMEIFVNHIKHFSLFFHCLFYVYSIYVLYLSWHLRASVVGLFCWCGKLGHLAEPLWRLGHSTKCDLLTTTYFLVICRFSECFHEDVCDCRILLTFHNWSTKSQTQITFPQFFLM